MVLYIGDKPVGLMKVVEKKVPKVKFGVSIDNLLGDVDENGTLTRPEEPFVLDLTGVKHVGSLALADFCTAQSSAGRDKGLVGVIANDVKSVDWGAFMYFGDGNTALEYVQFDGIEELNAENSSRPNDYGIMNAFAYGFPFVKQASFKSLKRIDVGHSNTSAVFRGSFKSTFFDFDSAFPSLEYVRGMQELAIFKSSSSARIKVYASKIHTCIQTYTGYNPQNYGAFDSIYGDIYLPSCTYVEGYLCRSATYKTVLHFAAAHQAAIETCSGYEYKFGAAEIYFDLMLNITVNGTVYSREYTIGGYTSWKDTDGNIVYTAATAEPAVGTVVYSDQGTTQVGTVSEVA